MSRPRKRTPKPPKTKAVPTTEIELGVQDKTIERRRYQQQAGSSPHQRNARGYGREGRGRVADPLPYSYLREERRRLGSFALSREYQNEPVASENQIVRRSDSGL
jgi:hypothetical protein